MTDTRPDEQLGDDAIGAGTTLRFVLLTVLLMVASAAMAWTVLSDYIGSGRLGCDMAAGVDPTRGTVQRALRIKDQWTAYETCVARYEPLPPAWVPMVWTALMLTVTFAIFFGIGAWKCRRAKVVPFTSVDPTGDIRATLTAFEQECRLADSPRYVVDRTALSLGAAVFGRTRRPIVRLNGGLLAVRNSEPHRFRAVVLHELGHVRNRDITITYLSVAMWRAFILLVLIPYLVWNTYTLLRGFTWQRDEIPTIRNIALVASMVVLIYLARADVLRSREVYADLAAVRWGADPRGWVIAKPHQSPGFVQRSLGSFQELWLTHPRWDLRRGILNDPSELFGVRGLPVFLTGAAAGLTVGQMSDILANFHLARSNWTQIISAAIAAAIVSGIVGFALCRAVLYASLTGQRPPRPLFVGLSLGAGGVAAELIMGRVAPAEWLPGKPLALLLILAFFAGYAWWSSELTDHWLTVWRARSLRTIVYLVVASSGILLTFWYGWWEREGQEYSIGAALDIGAVRKWRNSFFGGYNAEHRAEVWAQSALDKIDILWPFVAVAALTLAVFLVAPLAAWGVRGADFLPRLRRITGPAFLGAVIAWIAAVVASAHAHDVILLPIAAAQGRLSTSRKQQLSAYLSSYDTWIIGAVLLGALATSVIACALDRRHRLLLSMLSTQLAVILGAGGILLLQSTDGCVDRIKVVHRYCEWHIDTKSGVIQDLVIVSLVALAGDCVLVVIWSAAAQILQFRRGRSGAESQPKHVARPTVRRLFLAVTCIASVAIVIPGLVHARYIATGPSSDSPATAAALLPSPDSQASPTKVEKYQIKAWWQYGGLDVVRQFQKATDDFDSAISKDASSDMGETLTRLSTSCGEIADTSTSASRYFQVPAPVSEISWKTFIDRARTGGTGCHDAVRAIQDARSSGKDPDDTDKLIADLKTALDTIQQARDAFELSLTTLDTSLSRP
ncbi:M48 family metalloprotease [Nocardia sp. NPDC004711]